MAPDVQVVPYATACQTTLPWSQRPNWVGPLQTIAPSLVHWPELLALPEEEDGGPLGAGEPVDWPELPGLPEEEDGEPVGAAEPVEGPETPWPIVGERVG